MLGAKQNSQDKCMHHLCLGRKATEEVSLVERLERGKGGTLLAGGGEDSIKPC